MKDKLKSGVIFSTNPNYQYKDVAPHSHASIPKEQQRLRIKLDTKHRAGKKVTVVEGFVGKEEELEALSKLLKSKCGAGGSAKDGLIIIQGDFCNRIKIILQEEKFGLK